MVLHGSPLGQSTEPLGEERQATASIPGTCRHMAWQRMVICRSVRTGSPWDVTRALLAHSGSQCEAKRSSSSNKVYLHVLSKLYQPPVPGAVPMPCNGKNRYGNLPSPNALLGANAAAGTARAGINGAHITTLMHTLTSCIETRLPSDTTQGPSGALTCDFAGNVTFPRPPNQAQVLRLALMLGPGPQ